MIFIHLVVIFSAAAFYNILAINSQEITKCVFGGYIQKRNCIEYYETHEEILELCVCNPRSYTISNGDLRRCNVKRINKGLTDCPAYMCPQKTAAIKPPADPPTTTELPPPTTATTPELPPPTTATTPELPPPTNTPELLPLPTPTTATTPELPPPTTTNTPELLPQTTTPATTTTTVTTTTTFFGYNFMQAASIIIFFVSDLIF